MPIYMDRHDVSEEVTAEIVADLHQKDLLVQHKFNCKGLSYWFDEKRNTAFCLVEAPDKESIQKMHDHAHGEVAHRIIEVDASIVESFLGRIEDPGKSRKIALNIINDPAFRTIMVVKMKRKYLKNASANIGSAVNDNYVHAILKMSDRFNGRIVKQRADYFLISFDSVSNAVLCALEIQNNVRKDAKMQSNSEINIGLSAGIPVSESDGLFEDTILMADRLCEVVKGNVAATSEVRDLYESENLNVQIDPETIHALTLGDEKFLDLLLEFTEKEWRNTTLGVDDFSRCLGYSKSQLYRKMVALTGKSPNSYLKEYRLEKAIELMDKRNENVSEVAYETGFNSPAYFSKCFHETFGILPSHYIKSYSLTS